MKSTFNFNNLFYSLILITIFFSGFDGSLLYHRSFLDTDIRTIYEYFHFFFSVFAGWFVGYFLIQKIVNKYDLNYIFRVSLLISSLTIWTQYKKLHHSMDNTFSYLIIDNVICSILLGLLSYSLVRILKGKNEVSSIKKHKTYSLLFLILGAIYSFTLTDARLSSGFLISSLVYFFAYLFFLFNKLEKLDYSIKLNSIFPVSITSIVILLSSLIVYSGLLESPKLSFYNEESYPLFIYLIFLLFEASQQNINKITK